MVKVGFIVEGTSDFIILKSDRFQNLLRYKLHLESDESLIHVAKGKPKLIEYFKNFSNGLIKKGVEYIFILIDQDDDICFPTTKNHLIGYRDNSHYIKNTHIFIVMIKEMEAWFLADDDLNFDYEGQPEEVNNPSDVVGVQLGTLNHVIIAKRVKDRFSLVRASENSRIAKRFLDKLEQIASEN